MTSRRYPPPPPGNVARPVRVRARLSVRRWARLVDQLLLWGVQPLLLMTVLVITPLGATWLSVNGSTGRETPATAECMLVGEVWSCTGLG